MSLDVIHVDSACHTEGLVHISAVHMNVWIIYDSLHIALEIYHVDLKKY